ncbi:MAG: DUF1501 domain-containing protein [Gemmataceae bacterium]|nr:DUF1501 domain-containing protein [Gemmataceae bacterium]
MRHPLIDRRSAVQAGAIGLCGLGLGHLAALAGPSPKARACIYVFLSGGLSQHDSFDPKPDAPSGIRGEFKPIATRVAGTRIVEHLPLLAARADRWSLVRSLTHKSNDHSLGHHIMLTGRGDAPRGFSPSKPQPTDHPAIAAVARAVLPERANLPPAIVLPDRIVHNSGRVIPGQFAGVMGARRDPWFLEASSFDPLHYGAYPEYEFDHQDRPDKPGRKPRTFGLASLDAPHERLHDRLGLLARLDRQRRAFDSMHAGAASLLTSPKVRAAFDAERDKALPRYGANSFGKSLLMARRLVEAGMSLVQVNLGNNETWDTHGNAFPHLKDKLFPPTDKALSALLDDLHGSGLLDSTLVVMAGEFGRTPRISTLTQHYKGPGRDHWGGVQTVWLAGGGTKGGRVVGSSDRNGAYPATMPQAPENFAATIYGALGIAKAAQWLDAEGRPHAVYHGEPMGGLE